MKGSNKLYRNIFLALVIILGLITIYTIKQDQPPRIILFFGRFHPLLLHLPIGALIATFFIDILGRIQKNYPLNTIKTLLAFTAFFAIITCFLGYFLSLEGGYQKKTLNIHLYTGIGTAVLSTLLFFISLKQEFNTYKLFSILFISTLISISIAGHFGSILTHGNGFLTEYIKIPHEEKTIEVVDSLRMYENVVANILNDKCISCHNNAKQKAELSLLTKESILKGGIGGPSLVAGNAQISLLYSNLLLPISDEEHMPPEGKEQLTKDEIWLIEYWINKGADFENYAIDEAANDTLLKKLEKYLVFNKINIPKASNSDIKKVRAAGFRVLEIVPGKAELNIKCLEKNPSKKTINQLLKLKKQIVELDFHTSEITDEMTAMIGKLINLKSLRINSSLITDKTLKNLKKLNQLEVLNIYNTNITDKGLQNLLEVIQPKNIYTWNTQVDQATAHNLSTLFNVNIQNSIADGFVNNSSLEMPVITPVKTLFTDTINLNIKSTLKDVALRYTLNGKEPDTSSKLLNGNKLILNSSQTLKIKAFKDNWLPSGVLVRDYSKITETINSFSLKKEPSEQYPGSEKLFDLKEGSLTFSDGNWIGFLGDDLEAIIDLGSIKTVNHISMHCLENVGSWILFPTNFSVYTSERKNAGYKKLKEVTITRQGKGEDGVAETKKITLDIPNTKARYFKVYIKNYKILPKWHPGAGNKAWLFVDEIYFW